jgi:hypothetical protein
VKYAALLSRIFLAIALLATSVWGAPATAPSTRATTRATTTTRPTTSAATGPTATERRVRELTSRSIRLFEQGNRAEAEKVVREALSIDPQSEVNLYNLACLLALRGESGVAMKYLVRSAEAGFTDFAKIQQDSDLSSLHDLPAFHALLARKDELQRKAADKAIVELKEQFGEHYLYEVDPADKLIFATNTDPQTLATLRMALTREATALRRELFDRAPDQYIRVVLPSAEDYREMVHQPGLAGFYSPADRMLIARQLGRVMVHEFVHALHHADFDPLDQEHPIWLAEGLATLFEGASFDGEQIATRESSRLPALQRAAARNRLIPLADLLDMPQRRFVQRSELAYGESGSLLLFLREKGLLKKFYDEFKAGYAKDRRGKVALEKVTGKPLPQLETEWRQWMTARTPLPVTTGPEGAFLGVQFAESTDGLRIGRVVPDGAAAKAGLKEGDIIVGLGGTEVRDSYAFIPRLSDFHPGDKVELRVRRGTEYLTVPVTLGKRPADEED